MSFCYFVPFNYGGDPGPIMAGFVVERPCLPSVVSRTLNSDIMAYAFHSATWLNFAYAVAVNLVGVRPCWCCSLYFRRAACPVWNEFEAATGDHEPRAFDQMG